MVETKIIDIVNAPSLSDEELYQSYLDTKDKEVLGALFKKYLPLVFGVAVKYLGEKNAAQDAAMDVFEKLLAYTPQNEIKHFKAYLYVMTKNLCLMKQRGEKNIMVEISDRDMELSNEMHPLDEEPRKEDFLARCLQQLKDLQKLCVEQFYYQKKSYHEISKEQNLALTAVKSHIQNGKRNVKICLEGK